MMVRLNVMIVDDSSVTTHLLSSTLTKLGHKIVRIARTGVEAVSSYSACNPDVVIMDITMPDMDGIAATEKIVRLYPDARIIVVTSHAETRVVQSARKAGAKGYILKPFQIEKVRETLDNVMSCDQAILNA